MNEEKLSNYNAGLKVLMLWRFCWPASERHNLESEGRFPLVTNQKNYLHSENLLKSYLEMAAFAIGDIVSWQYIVCQESVGGISIRLFYRYIKELRYFLLSPSTT